MYLYMYIYTNNNSNNNNNNNIYFPTYPRDGHFFIDAGSDISSALLKKQFYLPQVGND